MRNITFSANEDLIKAARARAAAENSSLNAAFRAWLFSYARQLQSGLDVKTFLSQFEPLNVMERPTRDELNER